MTLITTWFINLILLPGRMLHTILTKHLAHRYDLQVYTIDYLEIASDRSQIIYESPTTLKEKYVLGLGPFFILNSIAISLYYLALTAEKFHMNFGKQPCKKLKKEKYSLLSSLSLLQSLIL